MSVVAAFGLAAGLVAAQAGDSKMAPAGAAQSDALKPLQNAEHQVDVAWEALPLQMRRAIFVTAKAPVFGAYEPRANATFKPGETLLTYIEPVGYTYQPAANGFVKFGVSLDFDILLPDGTVAAGKKNFLNFASTSRARVKELMLNASLDISGAPEGSYVLHWTMHDTNNGKITETSMPFRIAK